MDIWGMLKVVPRIHRKSISNLEWEQPESVLLNVSSRMSWEILVGTFWGENAEFLIHLNLWHLN